ncbi:MAG TPA: phytoene desaturase family protein, partial [Ferruginibacter sp.]|nr:phytoene desaturase family protein [Ferruginibacter sp.]
MHHKNAVIIGAGVAGLASAIRLAVQGYNVQVHERNTYPGGKLNAFEKEGFHFDTGPSLFTQPENIEELFELAGEPIDKYFSYQRLDVACKYFFENGKVVQAFSNPAQFATELHEQLKEEPARLTRYLHSADKLYRNIGKIFLDHSLHKRRTWFNGRVVKALATVRTNYLFGSLHKHNRRNFLTPEATQIFDRFATYNGSDPFRAPAMLSMIPHLEHNQGTYYPRGGMISITNALFHLAKAKGVQFYFDSPVQRIIHHENRVEGVVIKDTNVPADIVISNADVYFTYKDLLKDQFRVKKVLKQERSSSAIVFYWGVNKTFPELQLHNIFFSADYKSEFDNIFRSKTLFDDPTVYVNITAKSESTQAPADKENWFVMVNAPANYGQDWNQLKQDLRLAVIKKLNRML